MLLHDLTNELGSTEGTNLSDMTEDLVRDFIDKIGIGRKRFVTCQNLSILPYITVVDSLYERDTVLGINETYDEVLGGYYKSPRINIYERR